MKVGYARTSTDDQDVQRQVKQLHDHGIEDHLIFRDQGVSGAKPPEQRSGYRQLLSLVQTGEVAEIVVSDISRIGRDAKGTLQEIWALQDRDIQIISLNDLDQTVLQAPAELQPLLLSAVTLGADLQRKHIREDTKAGLRRAAEEGRYPGRPVVKIDYKKIQGWVEKGLSERAAVIVSGYSLSTYYRKKKQNKNKEVEE